METEDIEEIKINDCDYIHHGDATFINKKEVVREINKLRTNILNETTSIEEFEKLKDQIWEKFDDLIYKYVKI